ncbi:MAG: hypothetical protein OXG30_07865 [bacterium]|nr:hypothetical protein [bacterium]
MNVSILSVRFVRILGLILTISLFSSGVATAQTVADPSEDKMADFAGPSDEDSTEEDIDEEDDEDKATDEEDSTQSQVAPDSSAEDKVGMVGKLLQAVPDLEQELAMSLADSSQVSLTAQRDGGFQAFMESSTKDTLTLPSDSGDFIAMSRPDGTSVSVQLHGQAVKSKTASDVSLLYESVSISTHIIAQAKTNATVRILVLIEASDAPTQFYFPVGLNEDEELKSLKDGRVAVVNSDNVVISIINRPWAYDAAGNPIDSTFRIDNETLVFEVKHGSGTQYPIIADPDFNWGIISGTIYFDRYETEQIAQFGVSTLMAYVAVFTAIPTIVTTYIGLVALTILAFAVTAYYRSNTCLKIKVGLQWAWTGFNPFVNPGHYTCRR